MARLKMTRTANKQLDKLALDAGYKSADDFVTDSVYLLMINKLTAGDVDTAKKQIEKIQNDLNIKREAILDELREAVETK